MGEGHERGRRDRCQLIVCVHFSLLNKQTGSTSSCLLNKQTGSTSSCLLTVSLCMSMEMLCIKAVQALFALPLHV